MFYATFDFSCRVRQEYVNLKFQRSMIQKLGVPKVEKLRVFQRLNKKPTIYLESS